MHRLALLVLILYSAIGLGQIKESLVIDYAELEANIDGDLSETIWNDIELITGFYNHFPIDKGLAQNQTDVRIFHNGKYLYVGVVYHDVEMRNNVSSLKRDVYGAAMHLSDSFGIILDPYNTGNNGYYFGVNASGVQFEALIGNINQLNESWNAVWKSAVGKNGTDKIYEIAIPLDALNYDPKDNAWGIQLYSNDTKLNQYSTWAFSPRNYVQYDLRFTNEVSISNLPSKAARKYSVTPSLAMNYSKDRSSEQSSTKLTPSMDVQYSITPSLRLDMTVNPDFSQVEVDRQVTNLTRFAINFPERRKFFLENSDLFNNLGTSRSNPFYSRRIGAQTDILFGAKLSGNLGSNTRIGLMNVRTKDTDDIEGKNYTVLVGSQNLSNNLVATAFLVNSQKNAYYNRVAGGLLNYKSSNNRWTGNLNYAKAFSSIQLGESDLPKEDNGFLNAGVAYQTRLFDWALSYQRIGKNHITDTGFTPLLYNYDGLTGETKREAFNSLYTEFELKHIPESSNSIDWMRRINVANRAVLNGDNSIKDNMLFISPFSIRFKNTSYVYISFVHRYEQLKYNFDFLQNGKFITPGDYSYTFGRVGYWSKTNKKVYYTLRFEYGRYYDGTRISPNATLSYRLLPRAVLSASYEGNRVDLGELGQRTFHLARLTTELYFSNRLNWTTYVQYNTQQDNLNINSRVQWEYKPLSYVYLVLTNNYDNQLLQKNWGVSFKVNRRIDF